MSSTFSIILMKFLRIIERVFLYASSLTFVLMLVMVGVQVVNRYTLKFALPWTEEMTRMSYIVLIYFGSVVAVIEDNHIFVTIFKDKLPSYANSILSKFSYLISIIFFMVVTIGSYKYMLINIDANLSTTSVVKYGYVWATMCISSLIMTVLFLLKLFYNNYFMKLLDTK